MNHAEIQAVHTTGRFDADEITFIDRTPTGVEVSIYRSAVKQIPVVELSYAGAHIAFPAVDIPCVQATLAVAAAHWGVEDG